MITLYRRESDGRTRYVTITDRQGHLFGNPTLTVTEGDDFFLTRERHLTFETESEQQRELRTLIDRRFRSGYEVLYSFFRGNQFRSVKELLTVPPALRSITG